MKISDHQTALVGIVGGMGPRASTAFMSTIYELTNVNIEQKAARLILYSDPSIPDRTETFLTHRDTTIYEPFIEILYKLKAMNVSKIVVCCITLHYLFPVIPSELKDVTISLVDIIFSVLQDKGGKHLLLCTNGTLQLGIFQQHPLWNKYKASILIPNENDQQKIHFLIYQLKANQDIKMAATILESLLTKYGVNSFIAGCTEVHLLSRHLMLPQYCRQKYSCIDPLMIIAKEIAEERL